MYVERASRVMDGRPVRVSERGRKPDARVLFVVEQLRRSVPGGIGTYVRGLIQGLSGINADACPPSGLTLHASKPSRRRAGLHPSDPLAGFGLEMVISRLPGPVLTRAWDIGMVRAPTGFDVVHSTSLAAPPLGTNRDSHRGRSVVTVQDLAWRHFPETTTRRGRKWHEVALDRALRTAAAFVVPSQATADDLEQAGALRSTISVIPYGADHLPAPDVEGTDDLLRRCGVEGEFLLSVGTAEPRKNLDRLMAAYAATRSGLPEPWPLLLVGPTGWSNDSFSIDPVGVKRLGEVEPRILAGLYARARLFAYVPLMEGFGFPPLEAMSTGTPVVVGPRVPSVTEALDDGIAFIVDPYDLDSIANGLLKAATDETMRASVIDRGMSYARRRTWGVAAGLHRQLWAALQ
jgi:glycosyltransferase involved in cell wall biosynthesis